MVIPLMLKNNSYIKHDICFFHDILVDNIILYVGIAVILKSSGTGYVWQDSIYGTVYIE